MDTDITNILSDFVHPLLQSCSTGHGRCQRGGRRHGPEHHSRDMCNLVQPSLILQGAYVQLNYVICK